MNRVLYNVVGQVVDYLKRNKYEEVDAPVLRFRNESGTVVKVEYEKSTASGDMVRVTILNENTGRVAGWVNVYTNGVWASFELDVYDGPLPPVSVISSMYVVLYEIYELARTIVNALKKE